ncbi:MAG: hypothetical protein U1G05_12635 [Kiritimatiellia bacterium]
MNRTLGEAPGASRAHEFQQRNQIMAIRRAQGFEIRPAHDAGLGEQVATPGKPRR